MTNIYHECICGKKISVRKWLCSECREIYGPRGEWPEWLRFYIADLRREEDAEIKRREKHYDAVEERVVQRPRSSLDETYNEDGCVNLRGCREETHALKTEVYNADGTLKSVTVYREP